MCFKKCASEGTRRHCIRLLYPPYSFFEAYTSPSIQSRKRISGSQAIFYVVDFNLPLLLFPSSIIY